MNLFLQRLSIGTVLMSGISLAQAQTRSVPAHEQLPPNGTRSFNLSGAWVTVPRQLRVKKQLGPDFELFYFTLPSPKGKTSTPKQLLFAYSGFDPSFPSDDARHVPEVRFTLNGNSARSLRWNTKQGLLYREVLVAVKSGRPSPYPHSTYIHFAYSDSTALEAKLADSIIASVRGQSKPSR